ncbi:hypothetical protein IA54_021015 [Xanthomonas phaseoli pv. syngonii LMG 9055]|uniref:Integrase n=1 Tax=Xanthomonas phaseoli pv. syngonii LMG 9055 TaxID=1437878 RepID=A0A1V9HGV9_9XANT|nr:hypothetical protein IA54_021015 [Xanthomonas phaseoli pv. syngonii LMG 9055]
MASIQRNGNKYRVQVYVDGVRDSTTKSTGQEAAQWALEHEAELRGTKLPDKTFGRGAKKAGRVPPRPGLVSSWRPSRANRGVSTELPAWVG